MPKTVKVADLDFLSGVIASLPTSENGNSNVSPLPAKQIPISLPTNGHATRDAVAAAVASMLRMNMADGNDGSKRLYAAACRCAERGLSDSEALSAIRRYEQERPFPQAWSDEDIVRRLRSAERKVSPLQMPSEPRAGEGNLSGIYPAPQSAPAEAVDESTAEWSTLGPPQSIAQLVEAHPKLREPVIHGLLRRGETMNIVSGTKLGKSWLTYGVALCVATGKRLWDTFLPVPGRVLLLDNEIHRETLAYRIPRVAEAYGISPGEYAERLDAVSLRGQNVDMHGIGRYLANIAPGTYSLIIVDALYRTYPGGLDENSNADMTRLFNAVDAIAARQDAAVALVHHSTKGSQSSKQVTDVGSGAGAQSRACDTHLVLRPHEVEGVVVAEAALRSFPPQPAICLRFEWPCWELASGFDPSRLKQERPKRPVEPVSAVGEKVLRALADGPKTRTGIREWTGRNTAATADAIEFLVARGEIVPGKVQMRNGSHDGFRLANEH